MALQSTLVQYKGHQESGYEHRYGTSASRFPGRLPASVCLCCGSRYLHTLLPIHLAALMDIQRAGVLRGSGPPSCLYLSRCQDAKRVGLRGFCEVVGNVPERSGYPCGPVPFSCPQATSGQNSSRQHGTQRIPTIPTCVYKQIHENLLS